MSTGIENWAGNIMEIGPMYPFVGTEFVLFLVAVVLWVAWHVKQISAENKQLQAEDAHYASEELQRVIREHKNIG